MIKHLVSKFKGRFFFLSKMSRLIARDINYHWATRHVFVADRFLNCIKKDNPYDVIIAHELMCSGLSALKLARFSDNPLLILDNVEHPILSARSGFKYANMARKDPLGDKLITAYNAALASSFDYILTVNKGQIDTFRNIGVTVPCTVLKNVRYYQEKDHGALLRQELNLGDDDKIIFYPNNIYVYGGIEETILALSHLPKAYKLCFMGRIETVLKRIIKKLVVKYKLVDRVFNLGLKPPREVISYLSGADVVISPLIPCIENHKICLPNRIFDAIMARVPIIALDETKMGDFILKHNIGGVFADLDPKTMAETIQSIVLQRDKFAEDIDRAARAFCWDLEEEKLNAIVGRHNNSGKRCLIVAGKQIDRNDRVYRISKTMVNAGFDVKIIARSKPLPELCCDKVDYVVAGL